MAKTCSRANFDGAEQYQIVVGAKAMVVTAGSPRAMARATATLLQLVQFDEGKAAWPVGRIEDRPDLAFRCFMVDMGRNPHSPEVLRQIVDACWFYKVSYLHLHLTATIFGPKFPPKQPKIPQKNSRKLSTKSRGESILLCGCARGNNSSGRHEMKRNDVKKPMVIPHKFGPSVTRKLFF